jgi:hypothetical protein
MRSICKEYCSLSSFHHFTILLDLKLWLQGYSSELSIKLQSLFTSSACKFINWYLSPVMVDVERFLREETTYSEALSLFKISLFAQEVGTDGSMKSSWGKLGQRPVI